MDDLRSGSRNGRDPGLYDIVVIGGGVVGCAVLRELSRYGLKLMLLERASDVAEGVTKANSGVIHAGFNVPPGSLKARTNIAGLKTIYRMAEELGVPHRKTGKLVVARDPSEFPRLDDLREQGDRNGTPGLTFVDAAGVRAIEPGVRGLRALFSPETGIVSPYELTIALAESARLNGAVVLLDAGVTAVGFRRGEFVLATPKGEFTARWVVNAAGLSAGDIAALAGLPAPAVLPFRGEYLVSDKEAGPVLGMPVYPVPPRDDSFLGVHVTPTVEGNILLGPSSELVGDRADTATTAAVAARLRSEALTLVPDLASFPFIHAYAGIRPKLADFIVEESPTRPGWIDLFGIESPGLTAAPAIAEMVAGIVGAKEDLELRPDFEPGLPGRVRFAHADDARRERLVSEDAASGETVCRCEHATRAEVLAALRSPLAVRTFDSIKRRTRCGMGRCQGGFCTPRLTGILEANGLPPEMMTKRGTGSELFYGHLKSPLTPLLQRGEEPSPLIPLLQRGEQPSPRSPLLKTGEKPSPCTPILQRGEHEFPLPGPIQRGESLTMASSPSQIGDLDTPLYKRGAGGDLAGEIVREAGVTERHDIVIIGGGPAGLAAAIGARRAGASDVVVIERDSAPGGILNQCIHDGFGLLLYKETISGPEYAERLAEDASREGVRFRTGTMVLDLAPDRRLRVNSPDGYRVLEAGAVVLAMGCRERTREMAGIPGTRPAGVFTAGTAQNLVNLHNVRVGNDVVILGSGDVGLIMARRLVFEGIRVRGVFEILPWPSGLERNVRQCLMDFGIPLECGSTVTEVRGRGRVSSVVVARVDGSLRPVAGTEREVPCDTLLLSVGLIPENELSKRAGVVLSPLTGGAEVDETLMTSVPGVFSCGNVLHIHDVADRASFEGLAAGKAAAEFAAGRPRSGPKVRVTPGVEVRYTLPQYVRTGEEDFEVSFRVAAPCRDRWVEVRGRSTGRSLFRKKVPRLVPSELQKITVAGPAAEDMEVSCHE
jgi:glycerol-3-phosphate dehydrogenase